MTNTRRLFPTSIADEVAYLFELSTPNSLTYGFTLTLEGEVHGGAVRGALDACLNLYPKYKCFLVNNYPSYKRWFRYRWEYQDITCKDILEEIEDLKPDESGKDALSFFRNYHGSHSVDITRESPLKVMLIRQPQGRTHLLFFCHHAASDAIGFLFFLQSFVKFYEELFYHHTIDDTPSPHFESISQPEKRFRSKHSSLRCYYDYLKDMALLQREPPARLYSEVEAGSTQQLTVAAREVTPPQLEQIRATTKKHQTTINHYLLAAMFTTIKKWNQQGDTNAERIYITIPVNLRSPEDRTLGNIISGANISFRPEFIHNRDSLLPLVRDEQASVLDRDIARSNVNITWLLKPLPLQVKMLLFKHGGCKLYPTLTLSNMGIGHFNPHHKDEEGFHCLGPARIAGINAIANPVIWPQMLVLTYNNRMTMSLAVSPVRFSLEAAERFLDAYIQELTK